MEKSETLHLLLDLESLTKRDPRGAIVELGAVLFSPESGNIGESFFRQIRVTPDNELAEIDTLEWHRKQGRDLDAFKYGHDLKETLEDFVFWMSPMSDLAGVWSWGITYDMPRLDYRFDRYGIACPWQYYQVNDARSFWNRAFPGKKHEPRPHTAKEDAIAGAEDLMAAFRQLAKGNTNPQLLEALKDALPVIDDAEHEARLKAKDNSRWDVPADSFKMQAEHARSVIATAERGAAA